MTKGTQSLFPKLALAWVGSLLLTPFLIFSGVFINLYQLKMDGLTKYYPALIGAGLLYVLSPQLALIYLSASLLVGVFNSSFKSGLGLFISGLISVGLVSSLFFIMSIYFFSVGELSWELIQNALRLPIEQLVEAGVFKSDLKVADMQLDMLAYQAPSLLIVILMFTLFVSLIYEKSTLKWIGSESIKGRLSYFKLPDPLIWLMILSLAGGYIDFNHTILKIVALNLLNICVVCYFFQGFAVLFNFFEVFRVGLFTKFIMILCFVVQLSFVTVAIGVLDYWFNFRGRFIKKATQVKERSGL